MRERRLRYSEAMSPHAQILFPVKGPGRVGSQFSLLIVSDASYQGLLQIEKILFLAKVIAIQVITVLANFNRNSPKINFKIYLLQILSLTLKTL